jgi:hypothetical protein
MIQVWARDSTFRVEKKIDSSHQRDSALKISGHQQRWPRPLPGAILIPPALLVVADLAM